MLKNTTTWTHEEQKAYIISLHIVSLPGEEPVLRFLSDALAEALLPVPWTMLRDAHGRVCFANQSTGVAEWNHPLEPSLRELAGAVRVCLTLPSGYRKSCISSLHETWEREARSEFTKWYSVKHESGRAYYCHRETREAMWEHPAEVVLPAHYLKIKSIERLLDDTYFESICSEESVKALVDSGEEAAQGALELPGELTLLPTPQSRAGLQSAQSELENVRRELELQLRQAMESQKALHDELSSAEKDLVSAKAAGKDDRKRASQAEAELAEMRSSAARSRSELDELVRDRLQALESVKEMERARNELEAKLLMVQEETNLRDMEELAAVEDRRAREELMLVQERAEKQRIEDAKLECRELSTSRDTALDRAERAERMLQSLEARLADREKVLKDLTLQSQVTPSTPSRIMDSAASEFPMSPSSVHLLGTNRLNTLSECDTPPSEANSPEYRRGVRQPDSSAEVPTPEQQPPTLFVQEEGERAVASVPAPLDLDSDEDQKLLAISAQERLRSELLEAQKSLLEARSFISDIQSHSAQAEEELKEERKRIQNAEVECQALSRSRDTALERAQKAASANRRLEERLEDMRKALPLEPVATMRLPPPEEGGGKFDATIQSVSDAPTVRAPESPATLEPDAEAVATLRPEALQAGGLAPEELALVADLAVRAAEAEGEGNDVREIEAELLQERESADRSSHAVDEAKAALEAKLAAMEQVLKERDFAVAASYVERTTMRVAWKRAKEAEVRRLRLENAERSVLEELRRLESKDRHLAEEAEKMDLEEKRREEEAKRLEAAVEEKLRSREAALIAESVGHAEILQAALAKEQQRCAELEAANNDLESKKHSLELLLLTHGNKPQGPAAPIDEADSNHVEHVASSGTARSKIFESEQAEEADKAPTEVDEAPVAERRESLGPTKADEVPMEERRQSLASIHSETAHLTERRESLAQADEAPTVERRESLASIQAETAHLTERRESLAQADEAPTVERRESLASIQAETAHLTERRESLAKADEVPTAERRVSSAPTQADSAPMAELRDLVTELREAVGQRGAQRDAALSAEAEKQADKIEALQAALREEQVRRADLEKRQLAEEATRKYLEDRLYTATVSNDQFRRQLAEAEAEAAKAEAERRRLQEAAAEAAVAEPPREAAPAPVTPARQPVGAVASPVVDSADYLSAERVRVQQARMQCAELLKTVVDVLVRAEQADTALDVRMSSTSTGLPASASPGAGLPASAASERPPPLPGVVEEEPSPMKPAEAPEQAPQVAEAAQDEKEAVEEISRNIMTDLEAEAKRAEEAPETPVAPLDFEDKSAATETPLKEVLMDDQAEPLRSCQEPTTEPEALPEKASMELSAAPEALPEKATMEVMPSDEVPASAAKELPTSPEALPEKASMELLPSGQEFSEAPALPEKATVEPLPSSQEEFSEAPALPEKATVEHLPSSQEEPSEVPALPEKATMEPLPSSQEEPAAAKEALPEVLMTEPLPSGEEISCNMVKEPEAEAEQAEEVPEAPLNVEDESAAPQNPINEEAMDVQAQPLGNSQEAAPAPEALPEEAPEELPTAPEALPEKATLEPLPSGQELFAAPEALPEKATMELPPSSQEKELPIASEALPEQVKMEPEPSSQEPPEAPPEESRPPSEEPPEAPPEEEAARQRSEEQSPAPEALPEPLSAEPSPSGQEEPSPVEPSQELEGAPAAAEAAGEEAMEESSPVEPSQEPEGAPAAAEAAREEAVEEPSPVEPSQEPEGAPAAAEAAREEAVEEPSPVEPSQEPEEAPAATEAAGEEVVEEPPPAEPLREPEGAPEAAQPEAEAAEEPPLAELPQAPEGAPDDAQPEAEAVEDMSRDIMADLEAEAKQAEEIPEAAFNFEDNSAAAETPLKDALIDSQAQPPCSSQEPAPLPEALPSKASLELPACPEPVEEKATMELLPSGQEPSAAPAAAPEQAVMDPMWQLPLGSPEKALSEAKRALDDTKASSDLMQQRAAQASRDLEMERMRAEQSRRECAELSKERARALEAERAAERTRRALEEKLARAEKALQLANEGRDPDPELLEDLQTSPGSSAPVTPDGPGLRQAERAELALAEERKRTENVLKEYEKIAADHTSAMNSMREADRAKAALEAKLASVEQLLKNTEATLAAEAADEKVMSLQSEVKQHGENRQQLERTNAELDAKQQALQTDIDKALASNAALKEELLRKESEVLAAKAARDDIREHARRLADDITGQAAIHAEAEPVEEPFPEVVQKEQPKLEAVPKLRSSGGTPKPSTPKKHRRVSPSKKQAKALNDKEVLAAVKGEKLRDGERRGSGTHIAEPASVTSSLKVKNVDYAELCANPALLGSFQDSLRRAIASAAGPGVRPEHVELALSAGSVVVQAKITPPKGISVKDVASQLKSAPLEKTVVAAVNTVEGIEEVAKGPISVSELRVALPEPPVLPAEAVKGQEQPIWRPEAGGHKERSSSRPNRDGKNTREREARKTRRALEDAIVLASRIQLLRAEGARTRKKINQAMERKQAVVVASQHVRKGDSSSPAAALDVGQAPTPEAAPPLSLAARAAEGRAALLACNAALRQEAAALCDRQEGGPATAWSEDSGPPVSLQVKTKMAASKQSLTHFNTAVRNELEQLAEQLAELLRRRGELRQRAARPCWETPEVA